MSSTNEDYADAALENVRSITLRYRDERKWTLIKRALAGEGRFMCLGNVPAAQAYLKIVEFAFTHALETGENEPARDIAEMVENDRRVLCEFLTYAKLAPKERLILLDTYEGSKIYLDSSGIFPILPAMR